jgi:hypothetical protein
MTLGPQHTKRMRAYRERLTFICRIGLLDVYVEPPVEAQQHGRTKRRMFLYDGHDVLDCDNVADLEARYKKRPHPMWTQLIAIATLYGLWD